MPSLASSIVASLVLCVLLFTDPTEAACTTTALIAKTNVGANYVSAIGQTSANDCLTSDTQKAVCATTIPTGKFCAVDCDAGTITVKTGGGATVGAVGANVVFTDFEALTPTTKYVSTKGVPGTLNNGDCNAVGTQLAQTAWATINANDYVSTAGIPGDQTTLGAVNQMSAFSAAIGANKYFKTAGVKGTVTSVGTQVVTEAFTTVVPAGKYAKTKGNVGTCSAAGVFGTGANLPSDVVFGTCATCDACQTTTTACVTGTVAADGSLTVAGADTVCGGAACGTSGAAGVTVSMAACGLAAAAAALRT